MGKLKFSEIPAEPAHGFTLHYWTLRSETYQLATAKPRHVSATYFTHLPWNEHPWSVGNSARGKDFRNEWAIEPDHMGGGRSEGWYGFLGHLNDDPCVFASEETAWAALRLRVRSQLEWFERQLEELRERAAEIAEEPAGERERKGG